LGLFSKYSSNFAHFSRDILIKYILVEKKRESVTTESIKLRVFGSNVRAVFFDVVLKAYQGTKAKVPVVYRQGPDENPADLVA